MKTEIADEACCRPSDAEGNGFQVESVVTVDERGQMVLPKDLRARAGIRAGDKLAIIAWEKEGEVCCLSLVKTHALAGMVKNLLGPMMQEINTD